MIISSLVDQSQPRCHGDVGLSAEYTVGMVTEEEVV